MADSRTHTQSGELRAVDADRQLLLETMCKALLEYEYGPNSVGPWQPFTSQARFLINKLAGLPRPKEASRPSIRDEAIEECAAFVENFPAFMSLPDLVIPERECSEWGRTWIAPAYVEKDRKRLSTNADIAAAIRALKSGG